MKNLIVLVVLVAACTGGSIETKRDVIQDIAEALCQMENDECGTTVPVDECAFEIVDKYCGAYECDQPTDLSPEYVDACLDAYAVSECTGGLLDECLLIL